MKQRRLTTALVAAVGSASLLLAGCTGTENQEQATTSGGRVSFLNFSDFGGGTAPKPNYNPYLDAVKLSAVTYLFEPLMITEGYSCKQIPWLASSYSWTDPKTLVFKTREGVKWNDGEAFTAEDVAFSFNLVKQDPVLDPQGIWTTGLQSVTATAEDEVTMKFDAPGASAFTTVSNLQIVPEHVWSKVEDPTTFTNAEDPVGTGPMTVKSMNPQQLVVERNPDYWQADKIKVQEIRFHKADAGGQVEQLKLSRGFYDQNAAFV